MSKERCACGNKVYARKKCYKCWWAEHGKTCKRDECNNKAKGRAGYCLKCAPIKDPAPKEQPQPIFDFPPFEYLPWMERALCLDKELLQYVANQIGYTNALEDLFHPEHGQGRNVAKAAKAICAECPVMQECRAFAVPKTELQGIWGGLTEKERRAVRKQKGIVTRKDSKVRGLL